MKALTLLGCVVSDHDSSVCLLKDGRVVACVNEERLCRVRRGDPRNSIRRALHTVLAEGGVELADVGAIFCDTDRYYPPGQAPVEVFPDFADKKRIFQITHHLGHAASAFFPSPFDEAAFLTVDASGGIAPVVDDESEKRFWSMSEREIAFMARGYKSAHKHPRLDDLLAALPGGEARNYPAESLTLGRAVRGEPMVEIENFFADASLGYFYALCSHLLDMEEGSLMGLASYGRPSSMIDEMRKVIILEPEGRIRIDPAAMKFWLGEYVLEDPVALKRFSTSFLKTFGPGRKFFQAITPRHMDFAYAAQKRLEEALVHVARHLHEITGSDNLVIAGGVGLNSVANGVVLRETPFKNIFIQPAASDDGLALGNALFGHYVMSGFPKARTFTMGSAYLGPDRKRECDEFVDHLRHGTIPIEYTDSLPYVSSVDLLWRRPGEKEYVRVPMKRVGTHKHRAQLPMREIGAVEYVFEVRAVNPKDYAAVPQEWTPPRIETAVVEQCAAPASFDDAQPVDPRRPTDPFEMFLYDHRDAAGILDGERAFVGPEQVVVDPTNRCDNNCLGCWTKSPLLGRFAPPEEWHKMQMPADLMHRTIDELADLGTKRIRFTGGGEPFVHPAMMELLEHVKERGMLAAVTSNFTALKSDKVARMTEIGVDEVTASIWAGTPDMYARSHPSKTQKTFEKIESLLRELCASKKPHTKVVVANVLFSMNYMESREMLDFALRVGADGVYFAVVDSVAAPTDGLLLTPPHLKVVHEHLAEVKKRVEDVNRSRPRPFQIDNFDGLLRRLKSVGVVRGDYDAGAVDAIPCYVGWIFCRILPDGDVVPCCRAVDLPMGNLHKNTFEQIWNGAAYRKFRKMALTEKKSHPYFAPVACHRTCDNLMHNEAEHRRIASLTAEEKDHLKKFIVNGGRKWQSAS